MLATIRLAGTLSLVGFVLAQQGAYQQCGGINWSGPKACITGYSCQVINDYYYQCLPGSSTSSSSSASSSSSSSSSSTSSTSTTSTGPVQTSLPPNISPEWKAAYAKAATAVAKLSLQDKVNLATGLGWEKGYCVGNTPAISSINFPGLCLQDSPLGVRFADLVSAFPPGINAAATFNRTLIRARGAAIGAEFRGKGVNVALGPAMNPMRAPAGGRGWEGFGGDPYLAGEAAFETITGIQSTGVQACAKHYINNEQENFRDASSSNVDDRAQHEIYGHPFLRSVQANVASVMCSYNQINGSYSCENDATLNGLLKGEFGFPGYVMSDWWATHSTTSVNKGLDMTMPGDISLGSGTTYFGSALVSAVQAGTIPQSRIDDLARRILAAWYLVGQDSGFPAVNFDSRSVGAGQHVNVQGDHKNIIRQIGAASTVLLKNEGGILPLKAPASIAVIGSHAGAASGGPNQYTDRAGNSGVLAMGWGSGTAEFPYLITPSNAITTRAKQDGTTVTSYLQDDTSGAASAASGKSVALVFITADSGEGYLTVNGNVGDRNNLDPWDNGNALVSAVIGTNTNVIVVINSVGAINIEPWITNANVKAVVYAGLPGQEAGNSLVDVLYGAYNPSGRLPFTFGKSINDYSAKVLYSSSQSILPIPYSESIMTDYRHFDNAGIVPRYEFGYGLSYTTFDYKSLSVTGSAGTGTPPSGPGSSLDPWLHESVVSVSFTLTNNGTLAGTEVPQLYITLPASAKSAPKNLKGFDAVYLGAGKSSTVAFSLSRYDLSIWNTATQRWEIPSGTIGVSIGSSSRNIRLTGSI